MSEIEVNDYIRTKKGYIVKAKNIVCKDYPLEELQNGIICDDEDNTLILPKEIAKHSKNIIDLIEEGDYVNYERILDITGDYIRTTESIHNRFWLSNNIKSIVTKEQFNSIEYKVGE